jgi:hypothetical protein
MSLAPTKNRHNSCDVSATRVAAHGSDKQQRTSVFTWLLVVNRKFLKSSHSQRDSLERLTASGFRTVARRDDSLA